MIERVAFLKGNSPAHCLGPCFAAERYREVAEGRITTDQYLDDLFRRAMRKADEACPRARKTRRP